VAATRVRVRRQHDRERPSCHHHRLRHPGRQRRALAGSGDQRLPSTEASDDAVLSKDGNGEINLNKDETPVKHRGWIGLAAGAGAAILFPPLAVGLIGAAAAGAGLPPTDAATSLRRR
jgi:hypothetical protein